METEERVMIAPDEGDIRRHFEVMFRHATDGNVKLMAFFEGEEGRSYSNASASVADGDLEHAIKTMLGVVREGSELGLPVVFCPPLATFTGHKPREKDLCQGLAVTVDLDSAPKAGLAKLRTLLGNPTELVQSGGEWTDPATGEVQPTVHAHYRLSEPAETPEEHKRLKRLRTIAHELVGADPSGKSTVHCFRCPGTIHRKDLNRPRLAKIVECDRDREIHLEEALAELEGLAQVPECLEGAAGETPTGGAELLMRCAQAMTNPLHGGRDQWADWNRIGMAFYRASEGSEEGFAAFYHWSRKSPKHDDETTRERWEHYDDSPPERIGVGTLVWEARQSVPGFKPRPGEKAPRAQATDQRPAWTRDLITNARDEARDCVANIALILRRDEAFADKVAYDELQGCVVCKGLPWAREATVRPWASIDDTRLAEWCQQREVPVRTGTVAEAVQMVADDNRYHPVRQWLDGLRWDGNPRLDSWLARYLGVEESPYSRGVARSWLIAAVARIYRPGCKADHMLILEGPQGVGKSSALRALVPDERWFADELADLGSKDAAQDLRGKWLIEIGELSTWKRADAERAKAFVSRQVDHYRPSYGRRSEDHPRQCVFAGSTNSEVYFGDETGNRRYWPAKVGAIDVSGLADAREQLWAEAVSAYRAGERWHLSRELEAAAAVAQGERLITDPWQETILEYCGLDPDKGVTMGDLFGQLGLGVDLRNKGHSSRIAGVLKVAGWVRRQVSVAKGGREWRYFPPPAPLAPLGQKEVVQEKPSEISGFTTCTTCTTSPGNMYEETEAYTPPAYGDEVSMSSGNFTNSVVQVVRSGASGADPIGRAFADVLPQLEGLGKGWTRVASDRPWDDASWPRRYASCTTDAQRTGVVTAWGRAAGATVNYLHQRYTLTLPDLPSSQAKRELEDAARETGVELRFLTVQ